MAATYYPAIIERGAKGYSVFFPDLPGCASGGDTIDQAARHAEDALRGHLALMVTDGDDIPEATALDQIAHDPDVEESARILVRAELPGKSIRLNVSLDEGLVASIDAQASHLGLSRSAFLAVASRAFIGAASQKSAQK